MKPTYRRVVSPPFARCAFLLLVTAPAFVARPVAAQQMEESTEPRQPSIWMEPRISLQHTVTSNARLEATPVSDQVTEVIPGLRLVSNTARIKGFFDYSLRGIHYARGTGSDHVLHNLNANAVIEAIEQRAFVDVEGVVASQPISAFGAPVGGSPANPNATQSSSFRVSPYLRGRFGSLADYEARYSAQDTHTNTAIRSNILTQDWLLRLGNRSSGQVLGWSVDASQQTVDYSLGRNIDTATLRAHLVYAISPQIAVSGVVGAESTNQLSPIRESNSIVGLGAVWQPSERTRLSFDHERRYFGNAHNVVLEHRTGLTVWRYTDSQGVSSGQNAQSASLGSLFDLLNGVYARQELDPIRRTQFVLAEIERLGLPANLQVFPDFLRSSSSLQRAQQLSLAFLGQRSMLTLAATRTDNRRLDTIARSLGDDFDTNTRIRQRGWSLWLAHRLTPNSSLNASWIEQQSMGTVSGLETRVRSLSFGLNTLLAPRTNGGVQIRRVVSGGPAIPYRESAVIGTITHRF
ncbi:TIGR03016 family PEP-CTERM system-associated outer membrane protein [Acidovorax sp. SRB_14]|uniref:TIGR03016 family PEP-CTERM system-associated outer membrane protein n=1 Tax=Acidovorax sp. SRB_14 TaxID=1962699 RepID=UPI00352E855D